MIHVASTRSFLRLGFCELQDSTAAGKQIKAVFAAGKQSFVLCLTTSIPGMQYGRMWPSKNRPNRREGKTGGYPPCRAGAGASLTICQCHDYRHLRLRDTSCSMHPPVSTQKQLLFKKKILEIVRRIKLPQVSLRSCHG
jgi:hypothetical protein